MLLSHTFLNICLHCVELDRILLNACSVVLGFLKQFASSLIVILMQFEKSFVRVQKEGVLLQVDIFGCDRIFA